MSIIIPANSAAGGGGYEVSNSLRFHSDTYLAATFGSAPTLATKNTISLWFKRSKLDTLQQLYAANGNTANIIVNSNNTIAFYTNSGQLLGPRLYRDTSAWMHFVFTFDSTQGTAANRFKVYINGVEETSFNNTAYPAQNVASQLGVNGEAIKIGTRSNHDRIFEGYMAETAFVDGQALGADSFGEFDSASGVWRPIDLSGLTFGNNGFYLEYKQSGTGTNASGMGADTSGNDFNFAVNNFTAIDQTTDTCTNNFATWNPLYKNGSETLVYTEGNTNSSNQPAGANFEGAATIGMTSGKWYAEIKNTAANAYARIGITGSPAESARLDKTPGFYADDYTIYSYNGNLVNNNSASSYAAAYTSNGDIIGIAVDLDNNKIYFSKNGAWANGSGAWGSSTFNASTGAATITASNLASEGAYFFVIGDADGGTSHKFNGNFGNPSYSTGTNQDGNDRGNFAYAVPSGFLSLCTANLSEALS